MPSLTRKIIATVVGLVVGMVLVALVVGIVTVIYAPADPIAWNDENAAEAAKAHFESLPVLAFVGVLIGQQLGPFGGAFVCALIVRSKFWIGWLIIGGFFLLAGGWNDLVSVPYHPTWFLVADLGLYVPMGLLGGVIGLQLVGQRSVEAVA